jgi:hypothetical protein
MADLNLFIDLMFKSTLIFGTVFLVGYFVSLAFGLLKNI